MFIRKKIRKLKNGKIGIYYQAVESYRKEGKVKQRVVALGENPNIREVLKEEVRFLRRMEKDLKVPVSKYKEVRWRRGFGLVIEFLPIKIAEKRKNKLAYQYQRKLQRVSKLDSLANKGW